MRALSLSLPLSILLSLSRSIAALDYYRFYGGTIERRTREYLITVTPLPPSLPFSLAGPRTEVTAVI